MQFIKMTSEVCVAPDQAFNMDVIKELKTPFKFCTNLHSLDTTSLFQIFKIKQLTACSYALTVRANI